MIALTASVLIKTFVAQTFSIPSASMSNTLLEGDRILVNKLDPAVVPLAHGDIVVFEDPGGWMKPHHSPEQQPLVAAASWLLDVTGIAVSDAQNHLVKRIIGLPGDHVTCCTPLGQVTVNDVPLREPYLRLPEGFSAASGDPFDVVVPAGELWVLGDNRYNSRDSRYQQDTPGRGFVPITKVVGRAQAVTWPLDHLAYFP